MHVRPHTAPAPHQTAHTAPHNLRQTHTAPHPQTDPHFPTRLCLLLPRRPSLPSGTARLGKCLLALACSVPPPALTIWNSSTYGGFCPRWAPAQRSLPFTRHNTKGHLSWLFPKGCSPEACMMDYLQNASLALISNVQVQPSRQGCHEHSPVHSAPGRQALTVPHALKGPRESPARAEPGPGPEG